MAAGLQHAEEHDAIRPDLIQLHTPEKRHRDIPMAMERVRRYHGAPDNHITLLHQVKNPQRADQRAAPPVRLDEGAAEVAARKHAMPHCEAVHLPNRAQRAQRRAHGDERQQGDERGLDAHPLHPPVELDCTGWTLPGLDHRCDHRVETGGGGRDVHVTKRPRGRGDVPRPDVDGDHGAPDDSGAAGQFVEQAARGLGGGAGACTIGGDERGGDERVAEEAAALAREGVDGGGGGGEREAERAGGLEREREGVREGRVGERRERRVGGHAGEEGERVGVAAGVHVRRQGFRQCRQPLVAGVHRSVRSSCGGGGPKLDDDASITVAFKLLGIRIWYERGNFRAFFNTVQTQTLMHTSYTHPL